MEQVGGTFFKNLCMVRMNERVFYVPINALLGYIGTATSEGKKG